MTNEEDESLWCTDVMICKSCGHHWIAIHPCAEDLECSCCGEYTQSAWASERDEWLEYTEEDWEDFK
jgi:hypothetical protein